MTNQVSHAKLAECQAKIDALPPEQRALLTPLVEETKQRHYTLNKGFARLRDTVDDWRLAAKYLIYDLERTRDELQQLRKK